MSIIVNPGGTAAAVPPPFRPSEPALCGSCPLVTPYYCRLAVFICVTVICILLCVCVYFLFSLCSFVIFSFQLSPSVLWYCWLGLLTCKNRLPYNLYCVGGDVKHCSINQCEPVPTEIVPSQPCSHGYCPRPHPIPDALAKITISDTRQFQVSITSTNTQANTMCNSSIVIVYAAVQIKQSVQRDMRPCRKIGLRPSYRLRILWVHLYYCGITVVHNTMQLCLLHFWFNHFTAFYYLESKKMNIANIFSRLY